MPLLHYDKLLTSQNVVLDMPFYKNGLCDGGKAIDKSKYHNNATIIGATWTPPYGYSCDGVDDYLDVGSPAALNISNGDFSIHLVYSTVDTGAKYLASHYKAGLGGAIGDSGWWIGINGANITAIVINNNDLSYYTPSVNVGANNGLYHEVVLTRAANAYTLSFDGNNVNSGTTNNTLNISNINNTMLGKTSWTNLYVACTIPEFQIKTVALSAAEIKQHYLSAKRRMPWANLP